MTMTTTATTTMMMMRFDGFASRRADARDTNARIGKVQSSRHRVCVPTRWRLRAVERRGGKGRRGGTVGATSGEEDDGDAWEDDYGVDEDYDDPKASSSSLANENLDWRTQMKLEDMANASSSSKRFQDADDDDYFMKPASASAMKDDENSWASPSNPFMSSDFSSGPDDGWFDNDDWLQPAYTEVTAEPGSILEKVQRLHLGEPADHTFQDGEYFTLTNFVKQKADNDFCLVLEVAERARERKIERLESLHPTPEINALPEIQQVILKALLRLFLIYVFFAFLFFSHHDEEKLF